jgi:hypothetical protein
VDLGCGIEEQILDRGMQVAAHRLALSEQEDIFGRRFLAMSPTPAGKTSLLRNGYSAT